MLLGISHHRVVVCNLYPFEKTVAADSVCVAEAVENIDIGETLAFSFLGRARL